MADPLDHGLQIEIDGLRHQIALARRNSKDLAKRHFNTTRESALVFCLAGAAEISQGCDLVAAEGLLTPLRILARSLMEYLFLVCWIVKSDENAKVYVEATSTELKRILRKTLVSGAGKVSDRVTGEDKTEEFLRSDWFDGIPGRLRIEDLAKASGLERVYTQFYGLLSMHAHGTAFGLELANADQELLALLAMANPLLECINLVVERWVVKRKQTPAREIYSILMPPTQTAV